MSVVQSKIRTPKYQLHLNTEQTSARDSNGHHVLNPTIQKQDKIVWYSDENLNIEPFDNWTHQSHLNTKYVKYVYATNEECKPVLFSL